MKLKITLEQDHLNYWWWIADEVPPNFPRAGREGHSNLGHCLKSLAENMRFHLMDSGSMK